MHIRCPHCHNPIEILEDSSFQDVECPSCGSRFNFVGGDAPTIDGPLSSGRTTSRRIGHFELVEQLGVGSFGVVWKALDTKLDRFVAVKIPRSDQLDEAAVEKFFREARAAAQLHHSNIVAVHEVGRDGNTIFIASDYVEGNTLKDWLGGQPLAPREAAKLCATISEALHVAHEAGVTHRDLKPQNIMMDVNGLPHVADFGLAKRDSGEITVTMDGAVLGTPAYMPPEQAAGKGHEADRRSDVYSLGVILFEMLAGELPFRGEKQMLVVQIQRDEPPSPRRFNSLVPRDLETICLKCLEKQPNKRYQTAGELADDLQRFLRGEPIHARRVSQLAHLWRWSLRNPGVAAMLLVSGAALTGGMVGVTWQWLEAESAREQVQNKEKLARDRLELAENNLYLARKNLYAAHMILAMQAWQITDLTTVDSLLRRQIVEPGQLDLRGFEWYHLWGQMNDFLCSFNPEFGDLGMVAISPDGNTVAALSTAGRLRVWDISTLKNVFSVRAHMHAANARELFRCSFVVFSPDGRVLATGGARGDVKLWDTVSWKCMGVLKHIELPVTCGAFSPDGELLATSSGRMSTRLNGPEDTRGPVCIWDVARQKMLVQLTGHESVPTTVCFSPDGKLVATGCYDQKLRVWATDDWKKVKEFSDTGPHLVSSLSFTADSKQLVGGGSARARIWDVESGKLLKEVEETNSLAMILFAQGSRAAFARSTGVVSIWDTQTWRHLDDLRGNTTAVFSIAASREGNHLVTGTIDGKIKVWDTTRQYAPRSFTDFEDEVVSLAFSSDGELVASGDRAGYAKIWRRESGAEVATFEPGGWVNAVAFHPKRKILATACTRVSEKVRVWDYLTGQQIIELGEHVGGRTVAFSPDGRLLAAGGWTGSPQMHVWDTENWKQADYFTDQEYNFGVHAVAFSPDGTTLAAGCSDNQVRFINAKQGQTSKVLEHDFPIVSIAYSPDGSLLAAGGYPGYSPTVRVWSVETGNVVADLAGHMFCAWGLAFSPTGDTLATGSGYGQVYLWDTETWEARAQYQTDFRGYVFAIAFSPDGRSMACTNSQPGQRGGFVLLRADESMPSAIDK